MRWSFTSQFLLLLEEFVLHFEELDPPLQCCNVRHFVIAVEQKNVYI